MNAEQQRAHAEDAVVAFVQDTDPRAESEKKCATCGRSIARNNEHPDVNEGTPGRRVECASCLAKGWT